MEDWMMFAFGMALGVLIGVELEALVWRLSAKDFAVLKSWGRKFIVREWKPLQ